MEEITDYSAIIEKSRKINKKDVDNGWFSDIINKIEGLEKSKDGNVIKLTKHNYELLNMDSKKDEKYTRLFRDKILHYWYDRYDENERNRNEVKYDKDALLDIIIMIDYEYGASIWRYSSKRSYIYSMIDFMVDPNKDFWGRLEKGCSSLVGDLRKSCGKKDGGPENLASKICCCFSKLFFDKYNYYINDSVVRRVLPYYLKYYGIKKSEYSDVEDFDTISYERLHNLMDLLNDNKRVKKYNLDRHQLDFIMWYSYRFESEESVGNTLKNREKTIGGENK